MRPNFNFAKEDSLGTFHDLNVLVEEGWLMNTEVKCHIRWTKGMWEVALVFIAVDNPLQFVKWAISRCPTYEKAKVFGDHYRRIAGKDTRGYLKANFEILQICFN